MVVVCWLAFVSTSFFEFAALLRVIACFLIIKKLRKKLNEKGLLDEKGEVTKFRGVVIGQKIPGCPK